MDILKAKIALAEGKKVTHRFFGDEEYVYLQGSFIKTEDGAQCSYREFFSIRSSDAWQNDWDVFTEKR